MSDLLLIVALTVGMWWTTGRLMPLATAEKIVLMGAVVLTMRVAWLAMVIWG